MNSQDIPPYKLEKIVISMGLGNKSVSETEKIKNHFSQIMKSIVSEKNKIQKMIITQCRKSNAKFKIRKGANIGLKITLRKEKIKKFISLLESRNYLANCKYNNSTLLIGVKDHRNLRLEKYNYEAPNYGFNIAIVFRHTSTRVHSRRIGPNKNSKNVKEETCFKLLEDVK